MICLKVALVFVVGRREGVFTVDSNVNGRDVNIQKVRGGVFKQVISEANVLVKLMKVV